MPHIFFDSNFMLFEFCLGKVSIYFAYNQICSHFVSGYILLPKMGLKSLPYNNINIGIFAKIKKNRIFVEKIYQKVCRYENYAYLCIRNQEISSVSSENNSMTARSES